LAWFFLSCAIFGKIPKDPLDELCNRKYGVVAEQTASNFNSNQHAWTVKGDITLKAIRDLGPVIR